MALTGSEGESVMDYREILDLLRQNTEPSAGDYMLAVMMFVLWAAVVLVLIAAAYALYWGAKWKRNIVLYGDSKQQEKCE